MKAKRVLITGGSGFIGRRVLAHPFAESAEVHNLSVGGEVLPGVTTHAVDIRDAPHVDSTLRLVEPEAILHLAAGGVAYGTGTLPELVHTNVIGLHYLLDAASRLPRKPTVVIAGSGFEYASSATPIAENEPCAPFSLYGASKAAATAVASYYSASLPIVILRLFNLYGVGERSPRLAPYIIEAAQNGDPIELTAGEQVRDYMFADDAAEAFWRALALPSFTGQLRIFNVATGQPCTIRTFAETLGRLLEMHGFKPDFRFGTRTYRLEEPQIHVPSIEKLKQTFGWTPPTHLEDGLRRMIDAHLAMT